MFDKDLYDEDPFVDALFDWLEAEHATEPAIEVQLLKGIAHRTYEMGQQDSYSYEMVQNVCVRGTLHIPKGLESVP